MEKPNLSREQIEALRSRLLKSERFADLPILRPLLDFLFKHAVETPAQKEQILKAVFKHRQRSGDAPRPEIWRLREQLEGYFTDHRFSETVRARISRSPYQLEFSWNPLHPIPPELDRFWLPFTTEDRPAQLFINPRNEFWDAQPRRDRRPQAKSILTPTPSPLGLVEAVGKFSTFFQSREKQLILDSEQPVPSELANSVIVIGESPFDEIKPKEISLSPYHHEQAGWIRTTEHADHFCEEFGLQLFRCYARILRVSISFERGIVLLRILAHHSVAIDAAARFLLSGSSVEKLFSLMKPMEERTNRRFIYGPAVSDLLVPTIEELGVALRVTCVLTTPDAAQFKPAIPRNMLRIETIEICELVQPEDNSVEVWDPSSQPEPQKRTKRKSREANG